MRASLLAYILLTLSLATPGPCRTRGFTARLSTHSAHHCPRPQVAGSAARCACFATPGTEAALAPDQGPGPCRTRPGSSEEDPDRQRGTPSKLGAPTYPLARTGCMRTRSRGLRARPGGPRPQGFQEAATRMDGRLRDHPSIRVTLQYCSVGFLRPGGLRKQLGAGAPAPLRQLAEGPYPGLPRRG